MCRSQPALIHIHNIYSLSLQHQTTLETPVIDKLMARLQAAPSVHHVVTGDFNLHHLSWGSQWYLMSGKTKAERLASTSTAG